jgi:integrase
VAAVWAVLGDLPDPYGDLFRILVLVPLRRQEASLITGAMVDLEEGVLRLPPEITKTSEAFEIMLPTAALEIFVRRPREGYVFPSSKTGGPVKNWADTLKRIRRLSGVVDFRPHDMRRTFATEIAEMGVTFEVCDACLNHAQSASKNMVTRAYQLAGLESQKRHAMETWAAALNRAIETGSFEVGADNVVPIAG